MARAAPNGADPGYHRKDFWNSIAAGKFPEWGFYIQAFDEDFAKRFDFDVLDATKLIPEEILPLRPVGRMVLDRNPDNFFAETEQVAYCPTHIVPGIDFTNDPTIRAKAHPLPGATETRSSPAQSTEFASRTPH